LKIPKKITPCPILEAVIELRFAINVPSEAVFGLLYNEFKEKFPNNKPLHILQLPGPIREQDPNLKYQPHYKLENDHYVLQIGPRVMSLVTKGKYPGWIDLKKQAIENFTILFQSKIISHVERIGLRYINFFKDNIFPNTNIKLKLNDETLISNETQIRTVVLENNYQCQIHINNNSIVNNQNKGSVIDVDVFKLKTQNINKEHFLSSIEDAHTIEKKKFFTIVSDQMIKELNPEY